MSESFSVFLIRASPLKDCQSLLACYWAHDEIRDIGEILWSYRTAAAARAKEE